MNEIEEYQKTINLIFSCLEKLKETYKDNDNINMINNLEEYKNDAIEIVESAGTEEW